MDELTKIYNRLIETPSYDTDPPRYKRARIKSVLWNDYAGDHTEERQNLIEILTGTRPEPENASVQAVYESYIKYYNIPESASLPELNF